MSTNPPWEVEDAGETPPWEVDDTAAAPSPRPKRPLSTFEKLQQGSTGFLSGFGRELPAVGQRFLNLGSDIASGAARIGRETLGVGEDPEDVAAQLREAEKRYRERQKFERETAPLPDEDWTVGAGRLAAKATPQVIAGAATGGASLPAQVATSGGVELLQALSEGETPGKAGFRTLLAGGGAAVAPKVNALVTRFLKQPFAKSVDRPALEAFERLGVEAPASAVTHSKPAALAEQAGGFMIGGQKVTNRAEKALEGLNRGAEELAAGADPFAAGQRLSDDVTARVAALRGAKNAEYGKVGNLTGFQTTPEQTLAQIDSMLEQGTAAPEVLDRLRALRAAIAPKEAEAATAAGIEGFTAPPPEYMRAMDAWKAGGYKGQAPDIAQFAQEAAGPAATPRSVADLMSQQAGLEYGGPMALGDAALATRLRGLLQQDIDTALASQAPDQLAQLQKAKEAYGRFADLTKSLPAETAAKLAPTQQFDKMLRTVVRPGGSIKDIRTVVDTASPETLDQIRKSVIADIVGFSGAKQGEAGAIKLTPEQVSKAVKRWRPEVLRTILDEKQLAAIQDLATATRAMGKASRISGGSQTMPLLRAQQYLAFPASIITALFSGNPVTAGGIATGAGLEAGTAALIGSKAGQRWLTTGFAPATRPGKAVRVAGITAARLRAKADEDERRRRYDALLGGQ